METSFYTWTLTERRLFTLYPDLLMTTQANYLRTWKYFRRLRKTRLHVQYFLHSSKWRRKVHQKKRVR
ncbi:hypothetical protein EYF80_065151 [Liparis tanakae]|uniref:Uncharacterized protein n=1 Tax=Liparis tanakae TaxID=230148 RepID=A0A4Z2E7T7_9TELE|nr:hypothetical protein EYF80_065151 [Liparis tanakae]